MARHRRPAHLCAPVIQWGSIPKCKHEKPMRAGDWSCGECGAVNYARRQQCYVCDHKPACKRRCGFDADAKLESCEIRPGDWQCITCGSLCFARRLPHWNRHPDNLCDQLRLSRLQLVLWVRTVDPAIHDAPDTLHRNALVLYDSLALVAQLLKFVVGVKVVDMRAVGAVERRGISAGSL